ncbi:Alkyl hydroperoxide reductase AhpD [Roseimaritima multifibrata]|uniref:Alkyl hydroperoxide reductase AhpD n=1 Tax=Roseimaritima multifibrata TaxID=1930274 RepID=A0A517MGY5_9BACT|nr:carboxymuconolactone decarboxylase family protein [Roseimaritima multifibrata]QDS94141.1 Alkyl hydroperoxide reductase AhpD [Roseimaritima multifibrata]
MTTSLPTEMTYPKQLEKLSSSMADLAKAQPATMHGFSMLHAASAASGALDSKTKELIALAISVTDRCDGCIAYHTHAVLQAGASRDEVMETLGVAIMMGGGPSVIYATHVVEAMDQFENTKD